MNTAALTMDENCRRIYNSKSLDYSHPCTSMIRKVGARMIERLLTPSETAKILGVSPATLATWRATRRYPLQYVKVGRYVRYREADIKAFISEGERS